MRLQKTTGQLTQSHLLKQVKKDIARVKTLLTEKAGPVIAEARQIIAGIERIKNISLSARDALSSSLRLGLIYTIGPYLLPSLIPLAKKRAPQMPLIVEETFTAVLRESLKSGQIDAIVIALPFNEPGVITMPIYEEHILPHLTSKIPLYRFLLSRF